MKTVTPSNPISRDDAVKLAPQYVRFIEDKTSAESWHAVDKRFSSVKRGQKALTYIEGTYAIVTISSVNSKDFRAIDGPIVRVRDDRFSWRVDGNGYAWPLK